jgi:hypothetical protein
MRQFALFCSGNHPTKDRPGAALVGFLAKILNLLTDPAHHVVRKPGDLSEGFVSICLLISWLTIL